MISPLHIKTSTVHHIIISFQQDPRKPRSESMRYSEDDASSPSGSIIRPSSNEDLLKNLGPLPVSSLWACRHILKRAIGVIGDWEVKSEIVELKNSFWLKYLYSVSYTILEFHTPDNLNFADSKRESTVVFLPFFHFIFSNSWWAVALTLFSCCILWSKGGNSLQTQ